MMLKAVLFDYDGVIADSIEAVMKVNNLIVTKHGRQEYTLNDFRNGSMDWKNTYRQMGFTEAQIREHATMFYDTLLTMRHDITLFDGIEQVLRTLHTTHRLGMVTNSFVKVIEPTLGELTACFDCIVDAENGTLKPDPAPVLLCLKRMGIQPSEAAMVGDTHDDILAARRAGVAKVIAVSYGYHPASRLGDADMIVHSPAEILEALR